MSDAHAPDEKDRLYLAVRGGQPVSAALLDSALGGRISATDSRDCVLVAHWLTCEVTAAGRDAWWANQARNAPLRALGIVTDRYNAGWGGRSDYPLTTHVHAQLHSIWPAVYERALDERVVDALTGGPLCAQAAATGASAEAKLRAVALVAADLPAGLADRGAHATGPAPARAPRHTRRQRRLSAEHYYAALCAWEAHCPGEQRAQEPLTAIAAAAADQHPDPVAAMCAALRAGRRDVHVQETGALTFIVTVREHGAPDAVRQQSFSSDQDSFATALAWTDELREHCAQHNAQLAAGRAALIAARVACFAAAGEPGGERGVLAATRQAALLAPQLDASGAVRILRARL